MNEGQIELSLVSNLEAVINCPHFLHILISDYCVQYFYSFTVKFTPKDL